ncbi:site-specific integrase [Actinospica robiniae]|uniref:site-specific integrase n=1 Tax=Actinospica robiniae TaxID=304901 RepID=UPI00054F79E1|nr:site-specific integrase [Actinospica robiniae]
MNSGALYKRCFCKNSDGKLVGASCPKLKRTPGHGSWTLQLEVNTDAAGERVHLRRAGFETKDKAAATLKKIKDLLEVAADADEPGRARHQIAQLIKPLLREGAVLPSTDELRAKIKLATPLDEDPLLADFLRTWLQERRSIWAEATLRNYSLYVETYLVPTLGHIRLSRLRVGQVQEAFTQYAQAATEAEERNTLRKELTQVAKDLRAAGDHAGARLARAQRTQLGNFEPVPGPVTFNRIRAALRAALNCARKRYPTLINVASLIELPHARKAIAMLWTEPRVREWQRTGATPSTVMVWTAAQGRQFIKRTRAHPVGHMATLVMCVGTRRGESIAVCWVDLDFATGGLTICKQVVQYGRQITVAPVKTEAGERTVFLPRAVLVDLARLRKQQQAFYAEMGWQWHDALPIFQDPDGGHLKPEWVLDQFRLLTKEADLPPIRFHDLRHMAATLARSAGAAMKDVSAMLGHASESITSDLYTTVTDEVLRSVSDGIADQLALNNTDDTTDSNHW